MVGWICDPPHRGMGIPGQRPRYGSQREAPQICEAPQTLRRPDFGGSRAGLGVGTPPLPLGETWVATPGAGGGAIRSPAAELDATLRAVREELGSFRQHADVLKREVRKRDAEIETLRKQKTAAESQKLELKVAGVCTVATAM